MSRSVAFLLVLSLVLVLLASPALGSLRSMREAMRERSRPVVRTEQGWSGAYTVLDWNILACKWLDPSYYAESYPNVPPASLESGARLTAIVNTIAEVAPDILFMEEVSAEPYLFASLESMGMTVTFVPHEATLWADWEIPTQV